MAVFFLTKATFGTKCKFIIEKSYFGIGITITLVQ